MPDEALPVTDPPRFEAVLARVASDAASLEAFVRWLEARPEVEVVAVAGQLVKTEPPQRELTVGFRLPDGSVVTRTIDLALQPDGSLVFRRIHEP